MNQAILKDIVDDISMAIVACMLLGIFALCFLSDNMAEKVVIGAITAIAGMARGRNGKTNSDTPKPPAETYERTVP